MKIRERIKKAQKKALAQTKHNTAAHNEQMNDQTNKQTHRQTRVHVCMQPTKATQRKKTMLSKEKLWFWSEYMILIVLFVATGLSSPCCFFSHMLFNCCLLLVLCYCLFVFVLFYLSSFFFFFLLVHSFTEFQQSPHCTSRQHRGEEACQQGSPQTPRPCSYHSQRTRGPHSPCQE